MNASAGDRIPEWVMESVSAERMRTMAAILRDPNPLHWDRDAVAALPLEFRETVVLRELHDLSYREIAAVTGAPIGTVMSRLARGRLLLARALGGHQAKE